MGWEWQCFLSGSNHNMKWVLYLGWLPEGENLCVQAFCPHVTTPFHQWWAPSYDENWQFEAYISYKCYENCFPAEGGVSWRCVDRHADKQLLTCWKEWISEFWEDSSWSNFIVCLLEKVEGELLAWAQQRLAGCCVGRSAWSRAGGGETEGLVALLWVCHGIICEKEGMGT